MKNSLLGLSLLSLFSCSALKTTQKTAADDVPRTNFVTYKNVVLASPDQEKMQAVQQLSSEFLEQLHQNNDTIWALALGARPSKSNIFMGFPKNETTYTDSVISAQRSDNNFMMMQTISGRQEKQGFVYRNGTSQKFSEENLLYKKVSDRKTGGYKTDLAKPGGLYFLGENFNASYFSNRDAAEKRQKKFKGVTVGVTYW